MKGHWSPVRGAKPPRSAGVTPDPRRTGPPGYGFPHSWVPDHAQHCDPAVDRWPAAGREAHARFMAGWSARRARADGGDEAAALVAAAAAYRDHAGAEWLPAKKGLTT